jgi:hypothetical protein
MGEANHRHEKRAREHKKRPECIQGEEQIAKVTSKYSRSYTVVAIFSMHGLYTFSFASRTLSFVIA